jgi:hypothetical protein
MEYIVHDYTVTGLARRRRPPFCEDGWRYNLGGMCARLRIQLAPPAWRLFWWATS